ncbi:MAG: amino acid racemase [Oscillospiraceae bacterium]|jgi:aspartate racemase|nr:amino acid racemase [Oscillospiraceae bacterium]
MTRGLIGIVGGLGPAASAYFYELLIRAVPAAQDQDHPDVLLYSRASVPDRTAFLLGQSDQSPLPALLDTIHALDAAGASVLAIPCATAHHFYPALQAATQTPIVNMLTETAHALQGNDCVGLLATDGTLHSGAFAAALAAAGLRVLVPDAPTQQALMALIYAIKAGHAPALDELHALADTLFAAGAQKVILGCTELSLFARDFALDSRYVDAMAILAQRTLAALHA